MPLMQHKLYQLSKHDIQLVSLLHVSDIIPSCCCFFIMISVLLPRENVVYADTYT